MSIFRGNPKPAPSGGPDIAKAIADYHADTARARASEERLFELLESLGHRKGNPLEFDGRRYEPYDGKRKTVLDWKPNRVFGGTPAA